MTKLKKTTNRISRIFGVTLVEVLLVLAVAAMIIVLSIRYYQSAVNTAYANAAMQMLTNIVAESSNLQTASGSYSSVSTSSIQPLMPNNSMTTPWGGTMYILSSWTSAFMIGITNIPLGTCLQIESHVAANPYFYNVEGEACITNSGNTLYYIYPYANSPAANEAG